MMIKKYIFLLLVVVSFSVTGQNTGFYWNNLKESSNRLQGKIMGEIYYLNPLNHLKIKRYLPSWFLLGLFFFLFY